MTVPPPKPRIGLLALTLDFYEQLAPELRTQREAWLRSTVLPALEPLAEVSFGRAVFRREDVDEVVREHETAGVDALLVVCLTYAPSQTALPALVRTHLPVLIWNTQELFSIGPDFGPADLGANHGVHGTQDLCNVLVRSGVAFEYLTSHHDDPNGLEGLADFFQAASAVAGLRKARLGLMGYPFPGMGDFAVDTTHAAATLGCQVEPLSLETYHDLCRRADEVAVADLKRLYRQEYEPAEDLTDDDLDATARAEWALREMAAEKRLDALSFQFLALGEEERTTTLPFVAISRMMADGVGFAGEGDIVGAAGTWLLNRLRAPASFTEIFTIDFGAGGLLLSHMGEANVAMARTDRKPRLVARPKPIVPTQNRQLALVTGFEPGPATLCALAMGPESRWRLIASKMTIDDFAPLASMSSPHCRIVPSHGDVRDWLTTYGKAGGPHHHALCFGDATVRIQGAARLLDADYFEV